jgi:hypothetical protein
MAESNSMLEQNIQTVVPENLFGTDFIIPNTFAEKLKPSALDWNQTINKEDAINKFYFTENDGVNFVDESQNLTSSAFSTFQNQNQNQNQIEVSDGMLRYLGFTNFFDKYNNERTPIRRPSDVREINNLLIENTGYTWTQFNNNEIPKDVIETPEFQQGLDNLFKFYENKGFTVNIPERTNLTQFGQTLKGLGIETTGGIGLDVSTAPLLRLGWPGAAAYGIINFGGGTYLNYKAQELRLGQSGFLGQKDQLNYGELFTSGAVQTIPFGVEAKGVEGIAKSFGFGSVLGGSEVTVRTLIDEGRFPTFEEYLISMGLGGTFAASMKGGLELFQNLANKFKGKSASEINNLITKEEKTTIAKLLDDARILKEKIIKETLNKTAPEVHAIGPDLDDLSDNAKRVITAIESGNTENISKQEIIEGIKELAQKYPQRVTPQIKQLLEIDTDTTVTDTSKTTGKTKILPGTPHPTDANKVRGYDGRWVTKKHFDQVTESRKGANKIKEQVIGGADQEQPPKLDLNTDTRGKGDGGTPPPKGSSTVSQGDGPLKGTDTTPHQINPNQVTNAVGSDQQKQFNFIINRIKQLKDEGTFSQIKTTADTIDGGIKMLADTNKLKEHAKMYAKIYNLVPTDELNYALAEAITIATNKTTDINQKLIEAINVSKDSASIKKNIDELIESIGEIDEWLRLGIPLRTEQGRGLRSMQIPTQGVSPADYAKMSAAEKYKLKNLERSSVGIASSEQGLKLEDLKEKLIKAFEKGQETGDYTTLNKLTNTIKRANGSVEKLSALYETNLLHKIFSSFNKGNRIFNEIGINALLSAPTTNEINFISGVIETYMGSYELIRGAGSRVELDAAIRHLISLHSNASFALKAFTESFKTSDNYINRGAVKADYQEKFVISSQGKDILSRVYDASGKIIRFPSQLMTSIDALVQTPNLIASVHYQSHIEGSKLGFKGKDLDNYIKGNVDAIIEYYASNSGKGIKDPILARILKRSQDFAKRSTFTEDIRTDGYTPFGTAAAGINKMAGEIPAIRTLLSFIRAPTNIIKRQLRRSPVLNKGLKELAVDLESSDPIVRNQARGQVKVAKDLGITITGLVGAGILMQQDSNFIPPVIMTGGGPDWSTTDGRAVYKSMIKNGWLPYSVGYLQKNEAGQPLIGEDGKPVYKYYSYERLDPLSSWIGLMVDFVVVSGVLTDDEYDDFTVGWAGALARNLFDRSYLQQVNESMKAISGVEGSRENFWAKQLAARVPYGNFNRYAKQVPGDLLDIVGVSKKDSSKFHQRRDTKVKEGDFYNEETGEDMKSVRALRKLLNQFSETVPGYDADLPFLHEHITNERILYPHRPGLDLFNWVKTSTSKNHPLWTAMALIGKELKEPSDTFTGVGTSKQMEAFRLNTQEYAELKQIINRIEAPKDHPLYPGANINQAMRLYLSGKILDGHYLKNSTIIKENGPLSKKSQIARDEIYLKLKTINSEFINAGQLQWISSQGTDKIQLQFNKKRTIVEEYLNNIKALSPD